MKSIIENLQVKYTISYASMKKLSDIITYYILLFLGLIITSWIFWSRFLRERILRNIPDDNFTELRFWILVHICMIYLYVIKNLIKPKQPYIFTKWFSDLFVLILTTLDKFIKYQCFLKRYYRTMISFTTKYISDCTFEKTRILIIILEIIPRLFLVLFLIMDTFYFNKLQLFYKIVLIGLLPFISRDINYSLSENETHLKITLEEKYDEVLVFEKGYEHQASRKRETETTHHYEIVSVEKYIEIKSENVTQNIHIEDFPYEYVGDPLAKSEVYGIYAKKKYNNPSADFSKEDLNEIDKLFHDLMPRIINLKLSCAKINHIKHFCIIK